MVLATVTHHSFQVGTKYAAPWGQTTGTSTREGEESELHYTAKFRKSPPPGLRLAPLEEVAEPQVACERAACPRSVGAPSPSLPRLSGSDALDASALSFLVAKALEAQAEEKSREEEKELEKEEARKLSVPVSLRPGLRVRVCGSTPLLNGLTGTLVGERYGMWSVALDSAPMDIRLGAAKLVPVDPG